MGPRQFPLRPARLFRTVDRCCVEHSALQLVFGPGVGLYSLRPCGLLAGTAVQSAEQYDQSRSVTVAGASCASCAPKSRTNSSDDTPSSGRMGEDRCSQTVWGVRGSNRNLRIKSPAIRTSRALCLHTAITRAPGKRRSAEDRRNGFHEGFHGRLLLGPLLIAVRSRWVCGRPPGIRPLPRACRHGAGAVLGRFASSASKAGAGSATGSVPRWSVARPSRAGRPARVGLPGRPGSVRLFLSQASLGGARGVGDLDDHSGGVLPR